MEKHPIQGWRGGGGGLLYATETGDKRRPDGPHGLDRKQNQHLRLSIYYTDKKCL